MRVYTAREHRQQAEGSQFFQLEGGSQGPGRGPQGIARAQPTPATSPTTRRSRRDPAQRASTARTSASVDPISPNHSDPVPAISARFTVISICTSVSMPRALCSIPAP
jgi:hypothetical protein